MPEYTDAFIRQALDFAEKRYTPEGLLTNIGYQAILKEAYMRGIRKRIYTEEEIKLQIEIDGPGFDPWG
jgi:hypothetical protein